MNQDIRKQNDAATLIAQDVPPPHAPVATDLAPQVREMTRTGPGWVPSSGVSTPVASVTTADAPGAPGATQRAAFVLERPEPARVAVPALGVAPGERR